MKQFIFRYLLLKSLHNINKYLIDNNFLIYDIPLSIHEIYLTYCLQYISVLNNTIPFEITNWLDFDFDIDLWDILIHLNNRYYIHIRINIVDGYIKHRLHINGDNNFLIDSENYIVDLKLYI